MYLPFIFLANVNVFWNEVFFPHKIYAISRVFNTRILDCPLGNAGEIGRA